MSKRLNQAVKRNIKRFPEDFMFQLTDEEQKELVVNCDHLKNLKSKNVKIDISFVSKNVKYN